MLRNGTAAPQDERSPWARPGFIAAAAVVAVLVLLGLLLVITGPGSDNPATEAAKPAAPPPPAAQSGSSAEDSVCGLDAGSQQIPETAPKTAWKLRGSVAVPSAPDTHGPARNSGGVASCFAHSPTGALFAMVNVQAAMSAFAQKPGRYPIDKVRQMIASGPGRDALEAAAARAPVAEKGTTAPGAQVAGFKIVRYEPHTAVIDVAFAGNRPEAAGYVHGQSTMQWEDGDWKLVLTQKGAPFDAVQPIANLTGYVPWRGV